MNTCARCGLVGAAWRRQDKPLCGPCAAAFDRETRNWRIVGLVLMAAAAVATVLASTL